jgi:hypothetical protein
VAPDLDERLDMHKSSKLIVALGAAGIIAAGASAFTATSSIDHTNVTVGAVTQQVSGAHITNVVYDWNSTDDMTSQVKAKAAELLSPNAVKVSINEGALQDCTVDQRDVNGATAGPMDHSDITCDFPATADVASVRFIVNG